jgi:hypothetical protein
MSVIKHKRVLMTWLIWLCVGTGLLLIVDLGLQIVGADRWAELIRSHTGRLESGRVLDNFAPLLPARYNAAQLEGLPAPVKRYFRAVLNDGQPIVSAVSIDMTGKINLSTTTQTWKSFTSQQRIVTRRPGFLWDAQIALLLGVSTRVQDSYITGQGQIAAKLFGLFTIASAQGGGELARGEFMRYFAESPWYPTALLPSQGVRWEAIDDQSANATIVDGDISLTLLFRFNETGLITSVYAKQRSAGVGKDAVMQPWVCNFSNYQMHSGMLIPTTGEAAWIKSDGKKPYFVGEVKKVRYEFAR